MQPAVVIAQHVVASKDMFAVEMHDLFELFVYFAEHLERFDDFHRAFFKPVIRAQGLHDFAMDARYGGRSEIDRYGVGLFMLQGPDDTLSG